MSEETSIEKLWKHYQERIITEERKALEIRQRDLKGDNTIRYHYSRAGHYTFLSENFRHVFAYDGKNWPTAQHAYQTRKFLGADNESKVAVREEICSADEPRQAKQIAQKYKELVDLDFCQGWRSRQYMYEILCHKFNLRGCASFSQISLEPDESVDLELGLRLLNTGDRPIYHISDDKFWGISKLPTCEEDLALDTNWNGRILSIIRLQLSEQYQAIAGKQPQKLSLSQMVQRDDDVACKIPDGTEIDFLDDQYTGTIPNKSKVAGRFVVINALKTPGGSFVGQCYICQDIQSGGFDKISQTISTLLNERLSLSPLKDLICEMLQGLIDGSNLLQWNKLLGDRGLMAKVQNERFPNKDQAPDWWVELCVRLERAKERAESRQPLPAAHILHNLVCIPTISNHGGEDGRVFLKTFKPKPKKMFPRREVQVLREILQCSVQSPDLTIRDVRERLCHHEGVSAIYGGSHSAQILLAPSFDPADKTIPFVAMEYCPGMDLFDMCDSNIWTTRARAVLAGSTVDTREHIPLVRAVTHQLAMAVAHMHRSGVAHGDLKVENVMISPGGRVRLIDYGFMTRLTSATTKDDVAKPLYGAPELHKELPDDEKELEQLLKGNDVWMLAHLILVLLVGRRQISPGEVWQWQGCVTQCSKEDWMVALEDWMDDERLLKGLSDHLPAQLKLLKCMYAQAGHRCGVKELIKDKYWSVPAAAAAAAPAAFVVPIAAVPPLPRDALPHALNPILAEVATRKRNKDRIELLPGESFVPDMLLVPCLRRGGWLVARSAGGGAAAGQQLAVGDLVVAVDGRNISDQLAAAKSSGSGGAYVDELLLAEPARWRGKYNDQVMLTVRRECAVGGAEEEICVRRLIDMREPANMLRRDGPSGECAAGPASVPEQFRMFLVDELSAAKKLQAAASDLSSPSGALSDSMERDCVLEKSGSNGGHDGQVQEVPWARLEAWFVEFEELRDKSGWSLEQVLHHWRTRGWVQEPAPPCQRRPPALMLGPSFVPVKDEKRRRQARVRTAVTEQLAAAFRDEPAGTAATAAEYRFDEPDPFGRYVAYEWCVANGMSCRKEYALRGTVPTLVITRQV